MILVSEVGTGEEKGEVSWCSGWNPVSAVNDAMIVTTAIVISGITHSFIKGPVAYQPRLIVGYSPEHIGLNFGLG